MKELLIKDNLLNYSLGQKVEINENFLIKTNLEINLEDVEFTLRKISRIVFDKNEDNIDKLTTIFSTINSLNSDIFYILNNKNSNLDFYIGVANNEDVDTTDETLKQVFNSNFNGCEISETLYRDSDEIVNIQTILSGNKNVTMTTAIPSFKNIDEKKDNFIQGIEKFLLAMQDKDYTAILLAKNISSMIEIREDGYEELYTNLFPMSSKDVSFGINQSNSEGTSLSNTLNESITKTKSTTKSKSLNTPSHLQKMQMLSIPFSGLMSVLVEKFSNKKLDFDTEDTDKEELKTKDEITRDRNKKNFVSINESESYTNSEGDTKGFSTSNSINTNYTTGNSLQTTIKYENKFIKNKIDSIDMQLKRIKQSQNYGMYDFAAYFIANDISVSNTAANIYNSLIRGDESYLGSSYIIPFDPVNSKTVCKYLANFKHPVFKIDEEDITVSSMINSKELAIAMNLPKKSLHGILVKDSVEFGREIIKKYNHESSVKVGNIYHLGKTTNHNVNLSINDFAMHTLVTGATGSGKSTTTYKLIDELRNKKIKFLVIEPTKGEYKHIFGNENNVFVYGTNNNYTPLLKINPFSFPSEIHILEHIDRLVEIFNACWPMYAAMPAVLKDSILNAYENCGWSLEDSTCENNIFPTFKSVLESLEDIINRSLYSDNTKSDYKGALSTRIESLTKGLVGKIFDEGELTDEELFDENVIVDISRVGSSETKSLIMGILLLKLNQYRIAKGKMNDELRHVTVLEEAHHLLPRTSKEVSSESGNIKGKAVEMLSNSIAEMRTYGEGFIIVDQSPNMLDISAIRNTNTKIIMRLSELDDRNDIGKSATLSDEQIDEIPKLDRGVAVIYQNGWEESILSKIEISNIEIERKNEKYIYNYQKCNFDKKEILTNIIKVIALNGTKILKEERECILKEFSFDRSNYDLWAGNNLFKKDILKYFINLNNIDTTKKANFLNNLLDGETLIKKISRFNSPIQKKIELSNLLQKKIYLSSELFEWQVQSLLKISQSVDNENMISQMETKLVEQNLI
ncbi:ATP-binding protein [Aliarcobacter butzleri]|uniref:ATP-binding protein n=1 Tax=Aliarcobacter butzleri TaxID=28197 RepID=UPI0012607D1F|nr:ATP-binding protein [Aliarcobacter butzleri]MCT7562167.1 ATP-binding protein [Aliarcobacter butzleri]